ncbi:uncharacterized protein UV8b_04027 [Ustilaginoidea virens]|uniref:Ntf2 and rrm domain-containing protein n=1 Tax=Ustilaginoidea virens TaxID=1159556 RepID=A0A8E5MHC1_USTVR|nr:uncharacterized protein UV8b_04027 [Ustilaginoidea virens]QUC19786.1 hypothetical protein UV8b_04027 [Ustilaginoidea virens]
MAANGNFAQQEQYKAAEQAPSGGADSNAANNNLSKDEVGWYFVEQYYTTLSKSPEKLHLFYGKRSQFVYGLEAEVANVSVGRQAIQERIKALDFQDCKVRVSNVDSQATFDNIVIQVIGETSNNGAEPKKFVQTFVLAQQPSGYFVLNDILRYINDEEEQAGGEVESAEPAETPADLQEPAPTAAEPETAAEDAKLDAKLDADAVDEKLNQTVTAQEDTPVNGEENSETPKPVEANAEPAAAAAAAAAEAVDELVAEPEKHKETTVPSPAAKAKPEPAAAPAAAAAAEPVMPPKPMTWANRAAAAAGPRPVVPLAKTATPPAHAQTRAPAPAPASAAAASSASAAAPQSPAAAPAAATTAEPAAKELSGWQTAGADSKRQKPQPSSANATEKEGTLGYVKFVSDKVQDADLRNALSAHGELVYFDINRQKNCAFVEFKTVEGYQATVAANPHLVNGVEIVVEPRRIKATTYGGNTYNAGRGNASGGRGRGGFDGNRNASGSQRGNFSGPNRGRGGAARGRGGAQGNNA